MKVKVKLIGILSHYYPALREFKSVELEDGITVEGLRKKLGLSEDLVTFVIVNDEMVENSYKLRENDKVLFLPAVSGG
ncbi:MoaD/ThiS family protein [Thermovorax subterraneus]|jgi:molybdopterin converting factor small subunit|nr:MoaD/ThiS family protein [Thermovorax subterraneus]